MLAGKKEPRHVHNFHKPTSAMTFISHLLSQQINRRPSPIVFLSASALVLLSIIAIPTLPKQQSISDRPRPKTAVSSTETSPGTSTGASPGPSDCAKMTANAPNASAPAVDSKDTTAAKDSPPTNHVSPTFE